MTRFDKKNHGEDNKKIMKTTSKKFANVPDLGFGIGLRTEHYDELLENPGQVDWLEVISENFFLPGGQAKAYLEEFKEKFTLVPHGVGMSIGSTDPLNWSYLKTLKSIAKDLNAPWFSDHLCWNHHAHHHLHNLMPLPYTDECVEYVAERARIVQDFVEKPFILENVSSYVEFTQSTMPEWEFLTRIAEKANCGILLDVNNIFVSAMNHNFDPMTYINAIPPERVIQYHIAGHKDKGTFLLDTHDHDIRDEVWDLYAKCIPRFGNVSTMIERDDDIPPLAELLDELNTAKTIWSQATHAKQVA